ncbi:MAG: glycoside hydrolase, partial [Bacteroidetes bacterium]
MNTPILRLAWLILGLCASSLWAQTSYTLDEAGLLRSPGMDVTVFTDIYPDGHQTGVTLIQHGRRVAANGDLRLEVSPGQWSPVPKGGQRNLDRERQTITQDLWYPDSSKNRQGFNPILYPDLHLRYQVHVTALEGHSFRVRVDLAEALPAEWAGRAGFNLELFPGHLFGRGYLLDEQAGHFPRQANGPVQMVDGEALARPLASGRRLTVAPACDSQRFTIESHTAPLELWDGRTNHNNGWFIVRSPIAAGATRGAVEWVIHPHVLPGWQYRPVIQVSQLGYHPAAPKQVVIEQDRRDSSASPLALYRLTETGPQPVRTGIPAHWGTFLRYQYLRYDFSDLTEPGLYQVEYRGQRSHPFPIRADLYDRHAWQPVLEYYLPVQMCHMRINEKYRVWHDSCHLDDALMAPTDTNHFDGYKQGPETLTDFVPYQAVPGLNQGGWHDAGDYDLRVESQIGTVWKLALMIEEFGLDYDATLIDPDRRLVEIHAPDGQNDAIQQMEHGLNTVLGGYRALGRLYRGIICNDLRQYVMLGDAASMTDGRVTPAPGSDDRWVFTEDNPNRELYVAAGLAASARVLREARPALAAECEAVALALWAGAQTRPEASPSSRFLALSELILTTDDRRLKRMLVQEQGAVIEALPRIGWAIGRVRDQIGDRDFRAAVDAAAQAHLAQLVGRSATDSPYGVPYQPNIWGAGWSIQSFGVEQYFWHRAWPPRPGCCAKPG